MRNDRLKETWTVAIKPFLFSKYLETQELYFEMPNDNPSKFKGNRKPVEPVAWLDCVKFCNILFEKGELISCYSIKGVKIGSKLNNNVYQLQTNAEWVYACKVGMSVPRYGEVESISGYKLNSDGKTHEIGLKESNEWRESRTLCHNK